MSFSVQMPALGESVTEGTVTRWLKQEGDQDLAAGRSLGDTAVSHATPARR